MARFIKSRKDSHGKTPGSLIFIGNRKMEKPEINVMIYNREKLEETVVSSIDEIPELTGGGSTMWVNIYGLEDTETIEKAGKRFLIHPLELEDIMNTDQRPKVVENENNITVFLKILSYRNESKKVAGEHVAIVLLKNTVVTFQEKPTRNFEFVRERLRNSKGRIRHAGPDYLVYTLMDTLADSYIHTIESMGTILEEMEEEVFDKSDKTTLEKIYRFKTNIGFLQKSIFPLSEIMYSLNKSESELIQKKTLTYLKDLTDLLTQALEAVKIYHNMTNDYLNIYHSNVAGRTNEVMKVLTIFASVFIPLTFITGVYGTNFDFMPELHFKYGYFIMLAVMAVMAAGMLYFFKKKKWF